MLGFKPRISGVGSDHPTNWATTTAKLEENLLERRERDKKDLNPKKEQGRIFERLHGDQKWKNRISLIFCKTRIHSFGWKFGEKRKNTLAFCVIKLTMQLTAIIVV